MAKIDFKNTSVNFSGVPEMFRNAKQSYENALKRGREWQEARQKEKEARLFSEMLAGKLTGSEAMQKAQEGPVKGNLEHFYELMKGQGSIESQQAQSQAAQARAKLIDTTREYYPERIQSEIDQTQAITKGREIDKLYPPYTIQAQIDQRRAITQGQKIENEYAPDVIRSDLFQIVFSQDSIPL
jgi:hypothetical protein